MIIGRSDETKGFRVLLQKENKVTVTQHVRNAETLSLEQNNQLQRAFEYEDRAVELAAAATTSQAAPTTDKDPSPTIRSGKKRAKSWTRAAQPSAHRWPAIRRSHLATTAWWLMWTSAIPKTMGKRYAAPSAKAGNRPCAKSSEP